MWFLFVVAAVLVTFYIIWKYGGSDVQIIKNCDLAPGARIVQSNGNGTQIVEGARIKGTVRQTISRDYSGGRVSQVIRGCTVDANVTQKVTGRASGRNITQEIVDRHVTRNITQIDGQTQLNE